MPMPLAEGAGRPAYEASPAKGECPPPRWLAVLCCAVLHGCCLTIFPNSCVSVMPFTRWLS